MKILFITLMAAAVAIAGAGCGSLLPAKRSSSTNASSTEAISAGHSIAVEKMVETTLPPVAPVKIDGDSNIVDVHLETSAPLPAKTSVNARTSEALTTTSANQSARESSSTIPLGVNLALLGVGILIVLYAVKVARSSSVAVEAAYQTGDQVLARLIRRYRDEAMASTDPNDLAWLNSQVAHIEGERGRMAAEK